MTAVMEPHVWCDAIQADGHPCFAENSGVHGFTTASSLRAYLAKGGWHRTRHGDVCPDCWTDGRRPAPTTRRPDQGGHQTPETP